MADSRKIKMDIIEKAEDIAREINNGKDVEIVKTSSGIVFKSIEKKKIR